MKTKLCLGLSYVDGLLKVSMKSIGESKRDRSGEELWTAIKVLNGVTPSELSTSPVDTFETQHAIGVTK